MKKLMTILAILVLLCAAPPAGAVTMPGRDFNFDEDNLHQVDGPDPGPAAYRLYRSGAPRREVFASWCQTYGIDRVIVMSGDAGSHERRYQAEGICPGIEIIYDSNQRWDLPVSSGFLEWFDGEVERAKRENKGVLFRCKTGSHRTGRLAAYYRMKYQDWDADRAIREMDGMGTLMPFFDLWMVPQVRAIEDYVLGRPCSPLNPMCVR